MPVQLTKHDEYPLSVEKTRQSALYSALPVRNTQRMSSTVPSYWKKTECNATTVALKIENWDTFGGLEFFLFAGAPPHAANAQCIAPAKTLVDNEACVHWPIKKRSHVTCITHVISEETWFSAISSATRMDLWIHSSFQVSPSELWRCLSRTLTLLSSGHSPAHCFFFPGKPN